MIYVKMLFVIEGEEKVYWLFYHLEIYYAKHSKWCFSGPLIISQWQIVGISGNLS